MKFFIPSNLNLTALLQKNPPKFKYYTDNFIYLIGQITSISAKYKGLVDEQGYVPLHAPLLKHRVHNYTNYMTYLIESNILECNNRYYPGERSYGYRFAKHYFNKPLVPVEITKYTLLKSIRTKGNWERKMEAKYDFLNRWFNNDLQLDFEGALNRLEWLKIEDILSGEFNAIQRYNANYANLVMLKERQFYFHVDYTAGRLHTNLTALKKELRPYISYAGEVLVSVDVVSSQPFLIANVLLNPYFYERSNRDNLCYHDTWGSIKKEIDIVEVRKHIMNLSSDAELFRQDVQDDFYTAFMNRVRQGGEGIDLTRDDMKKAVFLVLYSDNKFIHQEGAYFKRIFKDIYPTVYALLAAYKKWSSRSLPVIIQHIESKVILSGVAKHISKRKKQVPLYTIHDSIVLPATEIELCKDVFGEQYTSLLGAVPNLKTEIWTPEHEYLKAPAFHFEEGSFTTRSERTDVHAG